MLQKITNARILVIDDHEPNVETVTRLLAHWGFGRVEAVTRSSMAVDAFRQFHPDLVLLDLHMPAPDGFELLLEFRKLIEPDNYIPILVLSGDISTESKQRALLMGARDFLSKPFLAVEVQLRVMNLLETRRLHLKLREEKAHLEAKVRERTAELERSQLQMLECLALAAEFRDDDTGEHTRRVGRIAAGIARELGLNSGFPELIHRAAPLHDIGKIGIPDVILLKPGRLDDGERDVIRTHAEIGRRILAQHESPIFQMAAAIAASHHERWDGAGYPYGLSGSNIPLSGRITAVADVFDALTHKRVYKKAWTREDALAEVVAQRGCQFDPDVVDAFVAYCRSEGAA